MSASGSATSGVVAEFLEANAAYAASFTKGDLPLPPARKVAVLACMDARLDVAKVLGLSEGDAHVIRNAGGVATDDAIRSLTISQRLLGALQGLLWWGQGSVGPCGGGRRYTVRPGPLAYVRWDSSWRLSGLRGRAAQGLRES
jgi:hypothetical protein